MHIGHSVFHPIDAPRALPDAAPSETPRVRDDLLIVDDEPKIGALLRAALERDGLGVEAVSDPEQALALLKERPFEVVLTSRQSRFTAFSRP